MKKLQLKNVKVVKLTEKEMSNVKGGGDDTSTPCNLHSHSFVSWCTAGGCTMGTQLQ